MGSHYFMSWRHSIVDFEKYLTLWSRIDENVLLRNDSEIHISFEFWILDEDEDEEDLFYDDYTIEDHKRNCKDNLENTLKSLRIGQWTDHILKINSSDYFLFTMTFNDKNMT